MGTTHNTKKTGWFSKALPILLIVIAIIIAFYPLPYYITAPGSAEELAPIIHVKGGDHEAGSFMLTTVRIGKANIPQYVLAKMSDYKEILPAKDIRLPEETDEEYNQRQLQMMSDSQHAATIVAYRKAHKKVDIIEKGVYVNGVIEGMPASGKIQPGDKIVKVDGKQIKRTEDLLAILGKKKAGDNVTIRLERAGKSLTKTVEVANFPKKNQQKGAHKAGIGIEYPVTNIDVKTNPPLQIKTSEIGGPSAGLMFTLEIYNQLTEGDLTKGHRIAGTGTMNIKEQVGPIGGIQQKVVAANEAKAEIFFAPVAGNNYNDAVKAAKDIKTKMKIVPVRTLTDALNYLKKLKQA
ncbi:SepM family pheromone-processing serine protease [Fictibacillus sp. Mic-4]|uniref:SepM family pheromone-processing serine protease n=1 Tax=Fictibacillus TaxID=1329200 RepID=UPI0004255A8B|nr:SepM family pheromone-processing serine protease [Fictibacillus gelatini]